MYSLEFLQAGGAVLVVLSGETSVCTVEADLHEITLGAGLSSRFSEETAFLEARPREEEALPGVTVT